MSANSSPRRRLPALRHDAQVELALGRLVRFARLEREFSAQLNEAGLRLLRASTFSAYCDCRTLGVAERAAAALRDGLCEPAPAEAAQVNSAVAAVG